MSVSDKRLAALWRREELSIRAIARMLDVPESSLRRRAAALDLGKRPTPLAPAPAKQEQARRSRASVRPAAQGRDRRVARAWRLADRQIAILEERLKVTAADAPAADMERAARALAVLVGALKELDALERAIAPEPDESRDAIAADDGGVDALRARIAQRLAGGDAAGPGAGDAGADPDGVAGAADTALGAAGA